MSGPAGYFYPHAAPRYRSRPRLYPTQIANLERATTIFTIPPVPQKTIARPPIQSCYALASRTPRDKGNQISKHPFQRKRCSNMSLSLQTVGECRNIRLSALCGGLRLPTFYSLLFRAHGNVGRTEDVPRDKDPSTRRSRDALTRDIRSRFHGRPG